LLGVALGVLSSISWGIADFLGGLQSRRISALSVLLVSQPVGLVLAVVVALAFASNELTAEQAAIGTAAGVAGIIALGSFYRAMALGSVSVVATIGALGVLVPVVGGLLQGEEPATVQLAGIALGIAGVLLVAREPDPEWRSASRTAIGLAGVAALGFGLFFLGMDTAAEDDPLWASVFARVGGVSSLLIAAAVVRPSMRIPRVMLPLLVLIGCFDISANVLFALATTEGLLSLVSVAGSLYSAVTILLARFVLGEQLAPSQQAGIPVALVGVALIASGA
jgi:drug/metabolite transporter (DMT)-like permease